MYVNHFSNLAAVCWDNVDIELKAELSNKVSMTGYAASEVWEKHGALPSALISHYFKREARSSFSTSPV